MSNEQELCKCGCGMPNDTQELEKLRQELATQNKHARYNNELAYEEMEAHKQCRQELKEADQENVCIKEAADSTIDMLEQERDFFEEKNKKNAEIALTAMRERDELAANLKEAKELLKVAACPSNCTDGAYPDHYGEPVQCQFCYERGELLKGESNER